MSISSATIKIFLVHGDPKRLKTAELSNWTGKAVAGPRSEFDDVIGREESGSSGVYLLTGVDPESGKPALYIGEAESIRDRVKAHLEKDFWNQIVFFISKDENLTKAHIRYLEGRLIDQSRQADRALLMNGQSSGAKLPESDREDMEVFLEKIHQLLPVLGIDLLAISASKTGIEAENEILFCQIKGLVAKGYPTPKGFTVLKGSQAVLKDRPSNASNQRQRLRDDGILEESQDYFIFMRDEEFTSPSAAAGVIHGGSANGLIVWKNKEGKSLRDIESA